MGKQPGDFIVFYGRIKSMKTWTLLFNAAFDYLENNERVLIWSREMNKKKICLRLASLLAGVDYQLFKKGKLPQHLANKAFRILEELLENDDQSWQREREVEYDEETGEEHVRVIGELSREARLGTRNLLLLCGRAAPRTIEELQAVIQDWCPSVVYLDSFYHLESERAASSIRWQRVAALAEDVKGLAEDEEIPIIATHQANKQGEKTHGETMSDMAESEVIAREGDLIIRQFMRKGKELYEDDYEVASEKERRDVKPSNGRRTVIPRKIKETSDDLPSKVEEAEASPRTGAELALVLSGNREGVLEAFTIHAIPGYNFSLISVNHSTAEIKEWVERDREGGGKTQAASNEAKRPPKKNFSSDSFRNWGGSKNK
jgi:replicative DNA helicase